MVGHRQVHWLAWEIGWWQLSSWRPTYSRTLQRTEKFKADMACLGLTRFSFSVRPHANTHEDRHSMYFRVYSLPRPKSKL